MGNVVNKAIDASEPIDLGLVERRHAFASPSASSRWLRCAAAPWLEKDLDDEPDFYSEEGTVAHEIAENYWRHLDGAIDLIGRTVLSPRGVEIVITQEMVGAVRLYHGMLEDISKELEASVRIEIHFDLYPNLCHGTADAVIVGKNKVVVVDFKYGAGIEVDPEENSQEMIYALGALKVLREKGVAVNPGMEVELVIVQPRHFKSEKVRRWSTTVADLYVWQETILEHQLEKIDGGDFTFGTGPHCAMCKAAKAGVCPAIIAKAGAVVKLPVELPGDIAEYSPDQLAFAYESEAAFKAFVKSAEAKYKQIKSRMGDLLSQGYTVGGYKLVAGRKSAPKYKDEADAVAFAHRVGVDPYEQKMKTPAKLRDELLEEAPTEEVMALFEVSQGVEIVPASSKKPALPVGPDAVFADIE